MQLLKTIGLALVIISAATLLACGGDDGSPSSASPTATQPDNQRDLFPPLEGPERLYADEVINYWEDHEFDLPDPANLPALPSTFSSLAPPEDPVCPEDWINFERIIEGFRLCYPNLYVIEGHGFVTAGVEERWYSVGFFDFEGEVPGLLTESCHVVVVLQLHASDERIILLVATVVRRNSRQVTVSQCQQT